MKQPLAEFLQSVKNKKILVWGLGVNGGGVGVAEFFAKHDAQVRVTDMKAAADLANSVDALKGFANVELILGEHREEDFLWADIVIRNPAIPPSAPLLHFAREHGKQIEMELSLFLRFCPGITVGITGTRGKTTTTALITEVLKAAGKNVTTGGNNRISLLAQLEEITADEYVVIEMSSFQLSGCGEAQVSPDVAIVTNIYPDHLNWHPDMQDYIDSKANIIRFQSEKGLAVLNLDNDKVKEDFLPLVKGKLFTVGQVPEATIQIKGREIWYGEEKVISEAEMGIKGEHNVYNMAVATAAALIIGLELDDIREVGRSFTGVEFRQQIIKEVGGVTYVNDTTATTPEGLIACLNRFGRDEGKRIHLICGGVNKVPDLKELSEYLNKYATTVHLFQGTFYDAIVPLLSELGEDRIFGPIDSMAKAVESATTQAQPGDYVILSPAAASFNMFKNEFDRGEQFNKHVAELL